MTFNVELYQVLVLLIPILGVGLKFYIDVQKRQVAYEKEIFQINHRLGELNDEVKELYKSLDQFIHQSSKDSKALVHSLHKIEVELQNKANR